MRIAHLHLPGLTSYAHASYLQTILVNNLLRYKQRQSSLLRSPSHNHHDALQPSSSVTNNDNQIDTTTSSTSNDRISITTDKVYKIENKIPDPVILTAQFNPIYTCGRRELGTISATQQTYLRRDGRAKFAEAMRGGQITFHGPGQMVAYPIFDLRYHFHPRPRRGRPSSPGPSTTPRTTPASPHHHPDGSLSNHARQQNNQDGLLQAASPAIPFYGDYWIQIKLSDHSRENTINPTTTTTPIKQARQRQETMMTMSVRTYISLLESSLINTLCHYSIPSFRLPEHPGVFISSVHKIASVGVHLRRHVTSHGVALNVSNEPMEWFERVVACGLEGVSASSIEREWRGEGGSGISFNRRLEGGGSGTSVEGESLEEEGRDGVGRMVDKGSDTVRKVDQGSDIATKLDEDEGQQKARGRVIPEVEEVAGVFVQKFAEMWNAQGGEKVEGVYKISEGDVLNLS